MTTERVGILGCGLMGAGIAEVVSCAGYDVRVLEQNRAALDAGNARINRLIDRAVDTGGISPELRALSLGRISYSTEVEELGDRDLIIEAVVEDLEIKNQLFRALDGFCGDQTIFASNTSSLTITEMAAAVDRADRMVGLHFFNPVRAMDLVEIVRTISTSDETLDKVTAFVRILGKESVTIRDSSGFLVNRLLVPFILDAIRLVEIGVASIEEIDKAMVLGCGHPMGPLRLCDFVGNDTVHRAAEIMYAEYREERYAPPPLLKRLVVMGRYGRKAGRGFYDYSGEEPVATEL